MFRSPDAEARSEAAYDAVMAHWPVHYAERDVSTRIGPTHVIIGGQPEAKPVVLLHGQDSSATSWIYNAEDLAPLFQVPVRALWIGRAYLPAQSICGVMVECAEHARGRSLTNSIAALGYRTSRDSMGSARAGSGKQPTFGKESSRMKADTGTEAAVRAVLRKLAEGYAKRDFNLVRAAFAADPDVVT